MNTKIINIVLLLTLILLVSCQVRKTSGEMILMPEGYSIEQTNEFLKSIIDEEFINGIHYKFPTFKNMQKAGFRYQPVKTKSFKGEGIGVIVKVYGLDDWEKKDLFVKHVTHHLKMARQKL